MQIRPICLLTVKLEEWTLVICLWDILSEKFITWRDILSLRFAIQIEFLSVKYLICIGFNSVELAILFVSVIDLHLLLF